MREIKFRAWDGKKMHYKVNSSFNMAMVFLAQKSG